jgi:hypothetical protein
MRTEIAAADRNFVVRRAAGAWRKAGEIDAAAEAAIAALYPDDRVRTSKIFRVLFFVFTWFGYSTASGFGLAFLAAAGLQWESAGFAFVIAAVGAGMLGAAEWLTAGMRLRRFGIEEACVWIGLGHLVGGGLWWLERVLEPGFTFLLIAACWATAGLATLAVWRWATPGMGIVAAAALFVGLSQAPANHLLYLLLGGLGAWPLGALSVAAHVTPEHRKRFGEAFLVFVLVLYAAIHVLVVEARLFPLMQLSDDGLFSNSGAAAGPVSPVAVALSLAAMVVVPAGLLLVGLARRHRAAIVLGLLLAGVSGVTFAQRWGSGPLWLRLIVEGAGLVALALFLRRALSRRVGAEWRGLTARALAEDRESLQTIEVAATLAAFSPAARQVRAGGFEGGGGEFGGGGASAKF